jgi:transcriptional regulator with XRE-family HTH domain
MDQHKSKISRKMEIRQQLGQNVRRLITLKGLSIRAFAREYGFPLSFLSRVVGGTGNPTLLQLQKLARALNTSIEKLLQ